MEAEKDRILDDIKRTAEGIAMMFGRSCETLIHDMSQPGHPIVAIYNSHVSGRHEGSTADIFGGDVMTDGGEPGIIFDKDVVDAMVITKSGKYIKSTTINYVGEGYHYALGINYDYTSLGAALSVLEDLTKTSSDLDTTISEFTNTHLEEVFSDCVALIGKPAAAMKKGDRIQLVAMLMQKNAFSFQKSIAYVADQLGVSRYTVYKYIHEVEESIK
jgi:Uncharacterized protein conserved in bacteria